MKKSLNLLRSGSSLTQDVVTVLLGLALAGALWLVTAPAALARLMTPTEMIEQGLPPGTVMKTANKPQFLTAVCAAVKEHRKAAPAIAETAVAAHREYAGDIVGTVVRCANGNCELTNAIVSSAIAATPDEAVAIEDSAVVAAPDCADAIQAAAAANPPRVGPASFNAAPPTNQPPFTNPGGGGGFDPNVATVMVCDNGIARFVPENVVSRFISRHPGSFVGSCQVTPATSR